MPEVELSAGTIEYEDTGGDGATIVLIYGLSNSRHWRKVVAKLGPEYRSISPTLPLGSHRHPMHPDADLSLRGMGRILAELMKGVPPCSRTSILSSDTAPPQARVQP
jgi:pimeloyl-ACP methyl ester carboxylesterase